MAYEDGEGVIVADISPGRAIGALAPIPNGFWTVELTQGARKSWDHLNALGAKYYAEEVRPRLDQGR